MSDIRLNVKAKVTKDKSDTVSKAKAIAKEMDNINKESKSISENIKDVFNKNAIVGWAKVIKDTFNFMLKATEKQTEYIENLNMMQVAFGDSAKAAENYIQKLSSATGFDQSGLTKQLGIFRQISSAMGYTSQMSDLLSTNLSKLSLDISSLYNVSTERAGKALESAITGQVRSIRSLTGADITQATLQQEAYTRGINKSVTEMTRAEKTILIYLTLERQLANANGDLSRTINSVANQTKIFKDQIFMAGRQLGSFFIPILKSLLPILNGVLMAFNTITGALLGFFGIDASSMAKEFGVASSGLDEIEMGLDGINKAGKEAKKSLRGFDKLNNITTPTTSSGGAGAGGIGFVDNNLKEALKEYNLQLDKMHNKATEIRDEILKILGFHQELNEETGQWEWKYGGIKTTIKNIYEWFTKLSPKAKLLATTFTVIAGRTLYNGLKKLVGLFGNTGLFKNISNLLKGFSVAKLTGGDMKNVVDGWSKALTAGEKLTTTLIGAGGVLAGVKLVSDAFSDMGTEGLNAANAIKGGLGELLAVVGGGIAGSAIGGTTGGIIGMIAGGLIGLVSAMDSFTTATTTNMKDIEEHGKAIDNQYKNLQKSLENLEGVYSKSSAESDYYKKLWDELQNIVDENGKIQEGYETRAKFITTTLSEALGIELTIVGDTVQEYKDMGEKIDDIILKKEALIKLDALEATAKDAIDNMTEARENESKAYKDLITAQENLRKKTEKVAKLYRISTDDLYDLITGTKTATELADKWGVSIGDVSATLVYATGALGKEKRMVDEANENHKRATEVLQGYNQQIYAWEKATEFAANENYQALDYYFDHERNLIGKSQEEQQRYWKDVEDTNKRYLEDLERNRDSYDKNTYDSMKKSYDEQIKLAQDKTKELTDNIQKNLDKNKPKIKLDTSAFQSLPSMLQKLIPQSALKAAGIDFKAEGGFVNSGEVYIARENGLSEYIGSFGNKTAVANNDQIVEGITVGVARGMKAAQTNTNVVIEATGDASGLLNFITFEQKKKDRQYGLG